MTIYKRGNYWQYDFILNGKRYKGTTGIASKDEAKAYEEKLKTQLRSTASIDAIWEQIKQEKLNGISIGLDIDELKKEYHLRKPNTRGRIRDFVFWSRVSAFIKWVKSTHPEVTCIGNVTNEIGDEYAAFVRSSPGASATINDKIVCMRNFFGVLGKSAGIIENPFENVALEKKSGVHREIFSPEELAAIGENANGWVRDLAITAIYTGLREGDICNLSWDSISDDLQWIHINRIRKTGRPLDIPILAPLREHLKDVIDEQGGVRDGFVYPILEKMYNERSIEISEGIKKFLKEIGITGVTSKESGYSRRVSRKDVHSFRHTFVYLAACNGIPFPIVQSIVGHASPSMTRIYMDHASAEDKKRFMQNIPDVMSAVHVQTVEAERPEVQRDEIEYIISLVQNGAPSGEVIAELRKLL